MIWAHVVPSNGRDKYAIERIIKDLYMLGHKQLVLKSDGEHAIVALKKAVTYQSVLDILLEESPVGEHQSNGFVDSAVKQVQCQVRTMIDALETRVSSRLGGGHPCMPWIVSHASATINRRRKDDSGVTAWRRWKGRDLNKHVAEFGEQVWYFTAFFSATIAISPSLFSTNFL